MKALLSSVIDVVCNIGYYYSYICYKIVPKPNYEPPTQDFGWSEFKEYVSHRHIILGFASISIAISVVLALVLNFDFMSVSMVGAICALITSAVESTLGIAVGDLPSTILYFGVLSLMMALNNKSMIKKFRGTVVGKGVSSWAMREELAFRAGAENWSLWERFRAAFGFGAIHFGNLFFPLAAIGSSTFAGIFYTSVYLYYYNRTGSVDTALKESASVHTVHNLIAFTLLAVVLVVLPIVLIVDLL